jgi:hypothetical protein
MSYPAINEISILPPKLPDEISAIECRSKQLQWIHIGHEGNDSFIMFATDRQLAFMQNATILCLDGTFDATPAPFAQVLVINAVVGDHSYPCAHFLLANKCTSAYSTALQVWG